MKNKKRALRRHHRERMIRKVMTYSFVQNFFWTEQVDQKLIRSRAVKFHNYAAVCSCPMCGNQRHNKWESEEERLTLQERRANDIYGDMLEDLDLC